MSALHIFDMDGTILQGTSASLELAGVVGALDRVQELEIRAAAGEIDNCAFLRECHDIWRDLRDHEIDVAFRGAPWIRGLRDVWADIGRRGEYVAVISLSPDFFVERLREWGAHHTYGSVVPRLGAHESFVGTALTAESKVRIAEEIMDTVGVDRQRCVAYGDSASDVALFDLLPHTVAVNADHHVRDHAAASYDGDDLREAYELGRSLLGRPQTR